MKTGLAELKKTYLIVVNALTAQDLPQHGYFETQQFLTDNVDHLQALSKPVAQLLESMAAMLKTFEG